jgi:hypothetical protein
MAATAIDTQSIHPAKVDWRAVATFYVIACAISWPIFWLRNQHPDQWTALAVPNVLKSWAPAFGPLIAGLLSRILFRRTHPARITLLGTSAWRSLAFAGVLVAAMTAVGLGGDQSHIDGLIYSGVFMVYGFCEETGWRGFLQDAVRPLPEWQRYTLIGVLWGAWHFTTFLAGGPAEVIPRLALMAVIWIGGSWGMGRATDATRSLTVAALLHVTFNLFRSVPPATAATVLAPCVIAWILLIRSWPRKPKASTSF